MINILCLQDTNYVKLCAAQTINDIAVKKTMQLWTYSMLHVGL